MTMLTGGCLCGGVRFEVTGQPRKVINCHCKQCRKTSGHYAAFASAPKEDVRITRDETLRWYNASPGASRGFCSNCGASLFWQRDEGPKRSFAAGCVDDPTGLTTAGHIYTEFKGEYYGLSDGLPSFEGSDRGALHSDSGSLMSDGGSRGQR